MTDFSTYQSPFSWRYGSAQMRALWSEEHKRRLWRRVWVALADAQAELGIIRREQADDLRAHQDDVDIARALAIEGEIHHDLMAELKVFAQQCDSGGGIIHLGATSMDIEDNADALRLRQSLDHLITQARKLLCAFGTQIEKFADVPTIAFTHLQPAEPTTIGYRLATTREAGIFGPAGTTLRGHEFHRSVVAPPGDALELDIGPVPEVLEGCSGEKQSNNP